MADPIKLMTLARMQQYNEKLHEEMDGLAPKATTLAGYGITDAYTKAEINNKLSTVYKAAGTCAFADLPTADEEHLGFVYSVSDAFTTTAQFIDGAGKKHPAGSNVAVVVLTPEVPESSEGAGDGQAATYGYDVLAGFVDLSEYAKGADFEEITEAEVNAMFTAGGGAP